MFEIALRGHPIGTAVTVVPTFHGPDDKPAEPAAKAAPAAKDPVECGIVRTYPHPRDQLWQLSHSTVIEMYDDAELPAVD